ncbi:MAG: CBS domain-containing membrane protein [Verrucomicrobiales bacterium]|jgi:CBS domain-containing membrane protein
MRKNEPVTHVMTMDPITVHHGDPISKVRQVFQENDIHHLPVVSGKELKGIISWTDLMRVSFGDAFNQDDKAVDATLDHTFSIEDIMKEAPRSLALNSSIRDAAEALSEAEFHALPVVDNGELVGIVTTKDLMRFLAELY